MNYLIEFVLDFVLDLTFNDLINLLIAIIVTVLVNKLKYFKPIDNSLNNNNLKLKGKKMIIWAFWVALIIFTIPCYNSYGAIFIVIWRILRFVTPLLAIFLVSFGIVLVVKANVNENKDAKKDDINLF